MPTHPGDAMFTPRRLAPQRRRSLGLSLLESLLALAILAVATGASLPAFSEAVALRRLDAAAAQLHTDLQMARSSAVAQHQSLRVSFLQGEAGSCYVVHTGSVGNCSCSSSGLPTCGPGSQAMRSEHFGAGRVLLQSNVASMLLDGSKGTVSPTGTVRLTAQDGRSIHLVVNIMGRVRKCSPDGAVPGYPRC